MMGILVFSAGCAWVAAQSVGWYLSQELYALNDQGSIAALVEQYYALEAVSIGVVLVGAYLAYRGLLSWEEASEPDSIRRILSQALSSRRDLRLGAIGAVLYGLVYLFISGVVIFQPGVNSGAWAGINGPGWAAAACCGSVGTVPSMIIYLSPQAHLALQALPLGVLFAVVVPLLVGFNVAVLAHSVRDRALRTNAGLMSSLGVLTGLFTGCPTCAGYFLAGAVGGVGATSLAIALAPYQVLFVVVSIPLLAVSPLFVSYNALRARRAACAIPASEGLPRP